jgi:hypothetical protein
MKRLSRYLPILFGAIAFLVVLTWTGVGHVLAQAVKTALVQDVDNPGRHPFQTNHIFNVTGCGGSCVGGAQDAVPTGERLVIDQVFVLVYAPLGQKAFVQVSVTSGGVNAIAAVPLQSQGGTFVGAEVLAGTLPGPLYADGGTIVSFTAFRPEGTTGTVAQYVINATGHFVTCPC